MRPFEKRIPRSVTLSHNRPEYLRISLGVILKDLILTYRKVKDIKIIVSYYIHLFIINFNILLYTLLQSLLLYLKLYYYSIASYRIRSTDTFIRTFL